jgi:ribose 1,5-bisphosphokinase PhnN
VEWAEVHGHFYGSPREGVEEALKAGGIVVFDIDVQGGRSIQRRYPEAVLVFVLPPTVGELERRLRDRGTETEDSGAPPESKRPKSTTSAPTARELWSTTRWSRPTPSSRRW